MCLAPLHAIVRFHVHDLAFPFVQKVDTGSYTNAFVEWQLECFHDTNVGEGAQEKKPRQRKERKPRNTEEADGGDQPTPKYRVKGEKGEEEGEAQETPTEGGGKKKRRNNKSKDAKKADGPAEPKYRVKGQNNDEEEGSPEKKGAKDGKDKPE